MLLLKIQDGPSLIYIDRHLVHEVTSPQAFDGLRMNNRKVRRPDLTIATMDHNVPTNDRSLTNFGSNIINTNSNLGKKL